MLKNYYYKSRDHVKYLVAQCSSYMATFLSFKVLVE